MKLVLLFFFYFALVSCNTTQSQLIKELKPSENKSIANNLLKEWYLLDPISDSLPGISLKKSLKFLQGKAKKEILIGVLDVAIDIEDNRLKGIVWKNSRGKIKRN